MKIFISWSDERSEALAKALRDWFPLVLHFAEPWLSKSDIQPGERWSVEIAKELEASNFGVICITRENLNSPWILFESGALAKSMQDGRVIPLLLDLDFKEISGPLAQFQAKKADQLGIKDLVVSLNKVASAQVPESQLDRLFSALWDDLEKQISSIPRSSTSTKHNRPQGEILEELVASVRGVEMRVRDAMDDDPMLRRKRRTRVYPEMLHELIHRVGDGPADPMGLLVIASLFRDDAPWISEISAEAYRAIRSPARIEGLRLLDQLRGTLEITMRAPFALETLVDRNFFKVAGVYVADLRNVLRLRRSKKVDESGKSPQINQV